MDYIRVNLGHGVHVQKICYLHNYPNSKLYLNTGYKRAQH
jgi:hypothetical protein